MTPKKPAKSNLEKNLVEIETLVEQMESKELDLEKSLQLFERGISLIKSCQQSLTSAEQKIQLLSKNQELLNLVDFHQDEN